MKINSGKHTKQYEDVYRLHLSKEEMQCATAIISTYSEYLLKNKIKADPIIWEHAHTLCAKFHFAQHDQKPVTMIKKEAIEVLR